ncbi:hypothetical protein EGW08_001426 [Elysia chlorotica]|uniref:Uncharacterized protein n=1 Tax=Elysia chlorotica TaxID=188477 RepID=A0A433UAG6_ELYCH|nr:hypothetical protein EGW08_001426 [Elysia chlorotica]
MPAEPGMHAPGSGIAHLLPAAGVRSGLGEVYRFHRVIPYYPPDPCIRPNEADMICGHGQQKLDAASMPPAGVSTRLPGDVFAFYKAREGSTKMPCQPREVEQPCPCSNSVEYPTEMPLSNFEQRCKETPNQTAVYNQQGPNMPNVDCERLMKPGYISSPCWPLPHQRAFPNPDRSGAVEGHRNPTPYSAQGRHQQSPAPPNNTPNCSPGYICRPVFDRKYLQDCPTQDGPPADSYTFL